MCRILDFLHNFIYLLKLPFLASLMANFSAICMHMPSKFVIKSAQKISIFSNKASYASSLFFFFFSLFFAVVAVQSFCFAFEERATRLHFLPNEPVKLQMEMQFTKTTACKDKKEIVTQGIQGMNATVAILDEESESTNGFFLHSTLNRFFNKTTHQGLLVSYDTQFPRSSIEMAQVSKLVGRPLKFLFTPDQGLVEKGQEQKVFASMPLLQELGVFPLLKSHLQELFILADKELVLGDKYESKKENPLYEYVCTYTIKEITDEEVVCAVSAKVHRQKFKTEVLAQELTGVVSGQWQGTAKWKLAQGLDFQQSLTGELDFRTKLDGQEFSQKLEWNYIVDSM